MRREGHLRGHKKGAQGERWPCVVVCPAHLYEDGLEATVVVVEGGTAVGLAGQVDACGTVQLLQLVVTTLLLDHPVGRAEAQNRGPRRRVMSSGESSHIPAPTGRETHNRT